MTSANKFGLKLKFWNNSKGIDLKIGRNVIYFSDVFQEKENINDFVIFSLTWLDGENLVLRSFQYFPLMIKVQSGGESSNDSKRSMSLMNDTLINLSSLKNVHIVPFNSSSGNYFYFEDQLIFY